MTLIEQVEKILPKIHGWCSKEKAAKFIQLILDRKPQLCVEIGVFGGSSLIPQAMALKENQAGLIYGIDPWTNDAALEEMQDPENKKWWGSLNLQEIYEHCDHNLDVYHVRKYCKLIKDKSENVVERFADNSIDVLHIDGNHSEELSYKDATLYFPKVKTGGLIFFDDIWWSEGNQVTTRKAITYLLGCCDRIDLVNNDCMILEKTNG